MAKQIKFTKEEIDSINSIRNGINSVFSNLGQIQIEKENKIKQFEDLENQLRTKYNELREEEQTLFATLNEKYGDGNFDPETGIFTPVETDDKNGEN